MKTNFSLSFKCCEKTHAFGFSLYVDIEHFSDQWLAKKVLVGWDDRFLIIILLIGLSMVFSLPYIFIKKLLLKLKWRKFKKNNNWKNYFIYLKSKSKSKSKFRYPNNGISSPSLYKKTKTRNLKINGFLNPLISNQAFKIY